MCELDTSPLCVYVCVRTVQVIKLISKDSIEDCILQLGQKKLKLEQDMTTAEQGEEILQQCMAFHSRSPLSLLVVPRGTTRGDSESLPHQQGPVTLMNVLQPLNISTLL